MRDKDLFEFAEKRGCDAFRLGHSPIPALDKIIMETIHSEALDRGFGPWVSTVLSAWSKGWNSANLKS